jgi:hypothetical protein
VDTFDDPAARHPPAASTATVITASAAPKEIRRKHISGRIELAEP